MPHRRAVRWQELLPHDAAPAAAGAERRATRGEGAAGTPEAPVENLFAIRRGPEGSRHLAFAGHLDVVPPGFNEGAQYHAADPAKAADG